MQKWSSRGYLVFIAILSFCISSLSFGAITLYTPPDGDAMYAWNSKYGPYGYTTGTTEMGVGLMMGGSYGNDYIISIFEIPISSLTGQTVTSAVLEVDSLGFSTGYYYGSAGIQWVNTNTQILTGDVVADNLGPTASSFSIQYYLFGSSVEGTPGTKRFDVLNHILDDLAAGRSYSTFVLCGSRDTTGSIYTAESGQGPRLIAVPEPLSLLLLSIGSLSTARNRKKNL